MRLPVHGRWSDLSKRLQESATERVCPKCKRRGALSLERDPMGVPLRRYCRWVKLCGYTEALQP